MQTAQEFITQGFTIIRNMIPSDETAKLYEYTIKNLERGNLDDGQVPGSPSFYQDKEISSLQKKLLPTIEKAIQQSLISVFCYHRVYRKGAILRMHKDSDRAQISLTMNLGQTGEIWDLWLVDYNENPQKISLNPGDALIYYGNKLYHWRGKLENSDFVSQIMFHFVNKNFKNTLIAKLEVFQKTRKYLKELIFRAHK